MRNHAHILSFAVVCLLAVGGALGGVVSASAEPPAPITSPQPTQPSDGQSARPAERKTAPDSSCAPTTLVGVSTPLSIRSQPDGGGQRIGTMPAKSKYLGGAMWVPVRGASADGSSLLVDVPWSVPARRGWIEDVGLERRTTGYRIRVSIARRELELQRDCRTVFRATVAVGGAATPTPAGSSFVTDLTSVPRSQPQFGSFAFGLSATQPNLPASWTGGDQMALHGTNRAASIGQAASTGCIRLNEQSLTELRRFVSLGTPVEIR